VRRFKKTDNAQGDDLEDGTRPLCHLQDALALAGHSVADKILAIVFPILAFVAAGFEYRVANMYFIPLGILLSAGAAPSAAAPTGGDLPRTSCRSPLGNVVGRSIISPRSTSFITARSRAQRVRKLIREMGEPKRDGGTEQTTPDPDQANTGRLVQRRRNRSSWRIN
jgi:Formate/nitrite transporter